MKVDPRTIATATPASPKTQPFKQLLSEARSELNLKKTKAGFGSMVALVAPRAANATRPQFAIAAQRQATVASSAHATTASTQQRSRLHADGEAVRLGGVRGDHAKQAESLSSVRAERTEAQVDRATNRLIDFITRELAQDPLPASAPVATQGIAPTQGSPAQHVEAAAPLDAPAESKAEQTVALIEKIETFVRSSRPGLCLTLNNSLGAQVEIERIGPREIALKLVGQRGPPSAEAVSRIREELQARGLKIGALSVS